MRGLTAASLALLALVCASTATAGSVFLIDGRGWGHGVGMSQWGAEGAARHGWTYKRILGHYYPHTRLEVVRRGSVRVLVVEHAAVVRISSAKPFRVGAAHRKRPLVLHAGLRRAVHVRPGAEPLSVNGTAYRGALVVTPRAGKLIVVNALRLDTYLRGVVPYEMPVGWSMEAYKAQTVVARSYALARLEAQPDFDLYADTRSQVYGGIPAERPETNLAVGATAGRALTYHGAVIAAYYFSSSGGWTASAATVWRESVPYLVPVRDPFDSISPYHRWGPLRYTLAGLRRKLQAPRLQDALPVADRTGRVKDVRLVGPRSARLLDGDRFRTLLGLRSTAFSIRVLSVHAPARQTLGTHVTLSGFARGLGRLRLERRAPSGAWQRVAAVRTGRDGRFHVAVRPRSPVYRVAAPRYDAAVEVRLRAGR